MISLICVSIKYFIESAIGFGRLKDFLIRYLARFLIFFGVSAEELLTDYDSWSISVNLISSAIFMGGDYKLLLSELEELLDGASVFVF